MYTKKKWKTGDTITEKDLNNLEDGIETISSRVLYVKPEVSSTTDSTARIQAILNDPNNQGGTVYFCKGEYLVGKLLVPSNIVLDGDLGATLKIKTGAESLLHLDSKNRVTIKNITLFGGGTATRPAAKGTTNGIYMTKNSRVTIDNVYIHGFNNSGIYVTEQGYTATSRYSHTLFITNCRIENNHIGMHMDNRAEYASVLSSTFGNNWIGCINSGGNNQYTGCLFNDNNDGYHEFGTGISNGSHHSITGCQFNHNAKRSFYAIDVAVGLTVSSCQFFDGIMEFAGSSNGIVLSCCEGGTWTHTSNQTGTVMFCNCFFFKPPTITNTANKNNTKYVLNIPGNVNVGNVSTSSNNVFTGSNKFTEDTTVSALTRKDGAHRCVASGSAWLADKSLVVKAGEMFGGVRIGCFLATTATQTALDTSTLKAVLYSVDLSTNKVIEKIFDGMGTVSADVFDETKRQLNVRVNKVFDKDTYILVYVERTTEGFGLGYKGKLTPAVYVTLADEPAVGDVLNPNTGNAVDVSILIGEELNICKEILALKNKIK